jgi:hypothetical protein
MEKSMPDFMSGIGGHFLNTTKINGTGLFPVPFRTPLLFTDYC